MPLGMGLGIGGPRQRAGGASKCRCPKCGYVTTHTRGIPCRTTRCPKCGTPMVGEI